MSTKISRIELVTDFAATRWAGSPSYAIYHSAGKQYLDNWVMLYWWSKLTIELQRRFSHLTTSQISAMHIEWSWATRQMFAWRCKNTILHHITSNGQWDGTIPILSVVSLYFRSCFTAYGQLHNLLVKTRCTVYVNTTIIRISSEFDRSLAVLHQGFISVKRNVLQVKQEQNKNY